MHLGGGDAEAVYDGWLSGAEHPVYTGEKCIGFPVVYFFVRFVQ